jgi:hypothetical protein
MGTTRPTMENLIVILQKIDIRLAGIADTLSYDGSLLVLLLSNPSLLPSKILQCAH